MNFKKILEILLEKTNSDILVVALKHDNGILKGNLFDTHYDLLDKIVLGKDDDRGYGFITPKGQYLTREDSLKWIKHYTPDVYKEYIKIIKKSKPQHPEFGYTNGLESVGYRKALGIEGLK